MEKNELSLQTTAMVVNDYLNKNNLRKGFINILKRDKEVGDWCLEFIFKNTRYRIFIDGNNYKAIINKKGVMPKIEIIKPNGLIQFILDEREKHE